MTRMTAGSFRAARWRWAAVLIFGLLTACQQRPAYVDLVKDFQQASAAMSEAAKRYFIELNKVEREAVIDRNVARRQRIDLKQLDDSRIIALGDLGVRLKAISTLLKYGDLLSKLASTNVTQSVQGSIDEFSTSLGDLEKRIEQLSTSSSANNEKFRGAVAGFAGIAKIIAADILNRKVDKALADNVKKAQDPIKNLANIIKVDLRYAVTARKIAVSEARVNATDAYNQELRRGDAGRLRKLGQTGPGHQGRRTALGVVRLRQSGRFTRRFHLRP